MIQTPKPAIPNEIRYPIALSISSILQVAKSRAQIGPSNLAELEICLASARQVGVLSFATRLPEGVTAPTSGDHQSRVALSYHVTRRRGDGGQCVAARVVPIRANKIRASLVNPTYIELAAKEAALRTRPHLKMRTVDPDGH
jgi:hypothetical protein